MVASFDELIREEACFPMFSRKSKMATYFKRCFCVLDVLYFFKAKWLNWMVCIISFTLSGQFVNSTDIHCADEWFGEKIRAPNFFDLWIYLCWGKRKNGVHIAFSNNFSLSVLAACEVDGSAP